VQVKCICIESFTFDFRTEHHRFMVFNLIYKKVPFEFCSYTKLFKIQKPSSSNDHPLSPPPLPPPSTFLRSARLSHVLTDPSKSLLRTGKIINTVDDKISDTNTSTTTTTNSGVGVSSDLSNKINSVTNRVRDLYSVNMVSLKNSNTLSKKKGLSLDSSFDVTETFEDYDDVSSISRGFVDNRDCYDGGGGREEDYYCEGKDQEVEEAECQNILGRMLAERGEWEEAVERGRRGVDLGRNDSRAWNNLGLTYKEMGRGEEAVKCFRRAVELHSNTRRCGVKGGRDSGRSRFNLGLELSLRDEFVESVEVLEGIFKEEREEDVEERIWREAGELMEWCRRKC